MDTSLEVDPKPRNRARRACVVPSDRWRCGFTLIELMIVIALIAIVAGLAIPNLLASRVTANENATVATLRTISTGQFQFKARGLVDRDYTGSYEYGTMAELAGSAVVRQLGERLSPPLLPASFGVVDALGRISRQGYLFALFLPDVAGVGLTETAANLPTCSRRVWCWMRVPLAQPPCCCFQ